MLDGTYSTVGASLEQKFPAVCKDLHILKSGTDLVPHILFIIDELCEMGGAERVLLKMVRLLPRRLFRCSLITFKVDDSIEELKHISCPLYVLNLKKTYDRNALAVASQIHAFVKREHVSVVHTFFETSDLWGGMVSRLSGVPVLVSSRRDLGILRSTKHKIAYKMMARFYDAVLAVSPQVREFCIREDGLKPSKVRTLFNGIELGPSPAPSRRAVMRRELGIASDAPVVSTIANIRKIKGLDVLVQAAGLVVSKYPKVVFVVAGKISEKEYFQELEKTCALLGIQKNVRFLGSREDVPSILEMSDVFCLPSRSEGFSNALIEAMACALPCVATDVGGNREALQDGKTGFIVKTEDWRDMARRLIALLDNREAATRMGVQGQEIVRSRFSADAMMRELVRLYQALLAEKGC